MTIAIALKVGDGLVLGADSATTIGYRTAQENVYFNAEKIVNLVKGLPIGALTFGLGGLGGRSVTRVFKDLRWRLCGADPNHRDWMLDENAYTVEQVAKRIKEFIYDEMYVPEYGVEGAIHQAMGIFVGGYSAGSVRGEVWGIQIINGVCNDPEEIIPKELPTSIVWGGQGEALNRLIRGFAGETLPKMVALGMPEADAAALLEQTAPLWTPYMPIQDAVDFVRYLATLTAGYLRFAPGPPTVAEPIDLAAITLHEGFRWVQRKHYYESELNAPASTRELHYTTRRGGKPNGKAGSGSATEEPATATQGADGPSDSQGEPEHEATPYEH